MTNYKRTSKVFYIRLSFSSPSHFFFFFRPFHPSPFLPVSIIVMFLNHPAFYLQNSLDQLQKAIKGFVVMSEELEMVYNAFLNNQVSEKEYRGKGKGREEG